MKSMPKHFLIFALVVQKCGGGLQVSLLLVGYTGTQHQLAKNKTQIWGAFPKNNYGRKFSPYQ